MNQLPPTYFQFSLELRRCQVNHRGATGVGLRTFVQGFLKLLLAHGRAAFDGVAFDYVDVILLVCCRPISYWD